MAQTDMDAAAVEAEKDLRENFPEETINQVAAWWKKHFADAGHKRLGRLLVRIAKENEDG